MVRTNSDAPMHAPILKSMQNCTSYGPDKILTFKCDLYLGSTWTNVSNGISIHDEQQLRQIILKSIHNCRSYGQTNSDARTYREMLL